MSTVLMMFILPIGFAFLYYEFRDKKRYQGVFDTFIEEVDANDGYTNAQKLEHIGRMLQLNGYETHLSNTKIVGHKKLFSIGALFVGLGFLYIGAILYVLYFFYVKKPHTISYEVKSQAL
ncbi:MAG: hypothetical protein KU37_10010 [Sulfuricurvum sp. PC08-66]|nr:MAG: hypothetical protein KU37_10010 [Sulfuricurvum sp. PC08-66]